MHTIQSADARDSDMIGATQSGGAADVLVIGGGLAGLAAAALLGRAGRRVTLFEKAGAVGGNAVTQMRHGYAFNRGPHALYRHGQGMRVLQELSVPFHGEKPSIFPALLYQRDVRSFWRAGLLNVADALELSRLFGAIMTLTGETLQRMSLQAWLDREVHSAGARALLAMLARLVTYADAPETQSAGSVIAQMRIALSGNVLYLDGGWQTLVNGLRDAAAQAGVSIITSARVLSIEHDDAVRGVRLADGRRYSAQAVIAAVDPETASALVDDGADRALSQWASAATPIEAACLDVALRCLPPGGKPYVLGIDQPLYLSMHSTYAELAPKGGALIHVAKYLRPGERIEPLAVERELEALLDQAQTGWRAELITQRFMPHIRVSNALVTAASGGMAGRPGCAVSSVHNLYVAGDWVGPHGLLADASLASAKQAAERILTTRAQPHTREKVVS